MVQELSTPQSETPVNNDHSVPKEGQLLESCIGTGLGLIDVLGPDRFLVEFPIDTIVNSLKDEPELRAAILTQCVSMPKNTGMSLPVQVTSQILQAALKKTGDPPESDTTPEDVLGVFNPRKCIDHLPWSDLAKFFFASNVWWDVKEGDDDRLEHATSFTIDTITTAIRLGCLTHDQLRDWLDIDALFQHLLENNPQLLKQVGAEATRCGAEGKPFTSDILFTLVSPSSLYTLMPLAELHDKVLLNLAESCGWNSMDHGLALTLNVIKAKDMQMKQTLRPPFSSMVMATTRKP